MPVLQQNVSTSIGTGPFVYSTDGFTVNGVVTATMLTVNLYKNGAVSTYVPTTANWSTATPSSRGMYTWTLTTDAVDTVGNWTAYLYTTNCLPVREDYVVRSSNVEDFITGTSAPGTPANVSSAVWTETTRTLSSAAVVSSQVWAYTSRDLSTYAGLSAAVWGYSTRNLTSFGVTLGADIWSVTTRLLSSAATISSAVWAHTTRTLTSAAAMWTETTRTLSTHGALSSAVWTFTSRDLTTYGGPSTFTLASLTTAVWAEAARTLTSYGGASTASVAQISTAVWAEASRTLTSWGGQSTASLDQITSGVWAYTSRDLSTYAGLSSAVWQETTRSLTTAAVITSDIMNRVYDGSLTFVQGQRLITGVLLGNSTGGGTTAVSFQNFGTTVARISYTVTTAGNRAVTTYSLTS